MGLKEEIEKNRQSIRTDSYPMSIGELINIYSNNELDIHPEFQRYYRWSDEQKTKLIESILLGIPLPSIFVSQREDGVWDVIDGLQRLSTIFQFLGILKNEKQETESPLMLRSAEYLPSLEGKYWDSFTDSISAEQTLDNQQKIDFKRTKINITILQKESDPNAKYELFQRLNTGGTALSDQEIRNCIFIMVNKHYFEWLYRLSEDKHFQSCIPLSERLVEEKYDMELVLRFMLSLDPRPIIDDDYNLFLTKEAKKDALDTTFNYKEKEQAFKKTFEILNTTIGSDAFRRYDHSKAKFTGAFLVSAFEVIAIGIGFNIKNNTFALSQSELSAKIISLWKNTEFQNMSGSGTTAKARAPRTNHLGRELFKNA